jgi:hypothetical protein
VTPAAGPLSPPPRFGGGIADRPEWDELLDAEVRWPDRGILLRSLSTLTGVGPKLGTQAAAAGVETVGELLWRVPRAYGQRPGTSLLGDLEPGEATGVAVRVIR